MDFLVNRRRDKVDALECKGDPSAFDPSDLQVFRTFYPKGWNYVVTPSGDPAYARRYGDFAVQVCTPTALRLDLAGS